MKLETCKPEFSEMAIVICHFAAIASTGYENAQTNNHQKNYQRDKLEHAQVS